MQDLLGLQEYTEPGFSRDSSWPELCLENLVAFFKDRIQVVGFVVILCFASVLTLSSQSGASYSTYILSLVMLFSIKEWDDVFSVRLLWLILGLAAYLVLTAFWSDVFTLRGLGTVPRRPSSSSRRSLPEPRSWGWHRAP